MQGTMIWFNPAKQHGYIQTDDGERLRVDETGLESGQVLEDRCGGTRVSFDRVVIAHEEPRAVNVTVMPIEVARRARRRGAH